MKKIFLLISLVSSFLASAQGIKINVGAGSGGGDNLGWINVKDYGALGDGTTDDHTAIQSAFDAVPFGGTVVFPLGTYVITQTIRRTDAQGPINIVGFGSRYGNSILRMTSSNDTAISITVVENPILGEQDHASSIRHLHIVGQTGNTSGTGVYSLASMITDDVAIYGFYNGYTQGGGGYYSRFNELQVHKADNAGFMGIVNSYNFNYHFINFRADSCEYGGYFVNTISDLERLSFYGGEIERNRTAGLYIDGVQALHIQDVYFESPVSGSRNIWIGKDYASVDVNIESNRFTSHPSSSGNTHIYLDRVNRVTISNNYLPGNPSGNDIVTTANTTNLILLNQAYVSATFANEYTKINGDEVRFSDLAGSGTRIPTISTNGVLAPITNGAEGEVLTMRSGVPSWDAGGGTVDSIRVLSSTPSSGNIWIDSATGILTTRDWVNLYIKKYAAFDSTVFINSNTLHYSTFTGTNGTDITGSYTPENGNVWTAVDVDFSILSNQAESGYAGGPDLARMITTLPTSDQDYRITTTITKDNTTYAGIIYFRATDVNNCYAIVFNSSANELYNISGGTATLITTTATGVINDTSPHALEITLSGSTVTFYKDATLVYNAVTLTGTGHSGTKTAVALGYGSVDSWLVDIP